MGVPCFQAIFKTTIFLFEKKMSEGAGDVQKQRAGKFVLWEEALIYLSYGNSLLVDFMIIRPQNVM